MKPSRVHEVLTRLLTSRWPVFLWGPPGVGKSSVVREVAAESKLEVLDIRAALLDPTDLRGIPTVENGRAVWCPPSFLPSDPDSSGLLFFDELSSAPPLVQASLYQLTLDRRVGEYELPPGWRVIAAGNRAQDASISFRMPAALANRFIHIEFEVDFGDWRAWAVPHGIHPLVLGFIATRRELLFSMESRERSFPTPRSWEMVSDALRSMGNWEDAADFIPGIVGEGAGVEFLSYCRRTLQEEDIRAVIEDPEHAPLPDSLGDRYALVSYLVAAADEAVVRAAAGVLLSRLPVEFSVLLARDLLTTHSAFMLDPGYQRFIDQHEGLLG